VLVSCPNWEDKRLLNLALRPGQVPWALPNPISGKTEIGLAWPARRERRDSGCRYATDRGPDCVAVFGVISLSARKASLDHPASHGRDSLLIVC